MTVIKIPYGDDEKTIDIPDSRLLTTVQPKLPKPLQEPGKATIEALENPTGTGPLTDLLNGAKKVALVTDNFARPTRYHNILPPLIKEIEKVGAEPIIIIANGGLRQTTREELINKLGEKILDSGLSIFQNVKNKAEDYGFVGFTSYGTPVYVNKQYLSSDTKIGIHTCQMTLWGYGGGGSIVLPGICMHETIEWNHHFGISEGSLTPGYVGEKNFLRKDIDEAARLSGISTIVNFVINPNGEILNVNAGGVDASFKNAIDRFDEIYSYRLKEKQQADIAIGGAFKWDKYLAHACWGISTLNPVTRDGGTIIVVAPCPNGLAHFNFIKNYMPPNMKNLRRLLMDVYYLKQELWHVILWYPIYMIMMKKNVIVVTEEKNHEALKNLGIFATTSLEEAYEKASSKHGPKAKVIAAPYSKWAKPIFD
ncbi:MAG: lactate racemase domain-containing protein [Candidatus Bathyarchaeota archaeon]|nr:lactate racemase domain-containing protein [Candidatus Bathyarchaeota archaeon]